MPKNMTYEEFMNYGAPTEGGGTAVAPLPKKKMTYDEFMNLGAPTAEDYTAAYQGIKNQQPLGESPSDAYQRNIKLAADMDQGNRGAITGSAPYRVAEDIVSASASAIVNPLLSAESALGIDAAGDMLSQRQAQYDISHNREMGFAQRMAGAAGESLAGFAALSLAGSGLGSALGLGAKGAKAAKWGTIGSGLYVKSHDDAYRNAINTGKTEDEAKKIARAVGALEVGVMGAFQVAGLGGVEGAIASGLGANAAKGAASKMSLQGAKRFFTQIAADITDENITTLTQNLAEQGNAGSLRDYIETTVVSAGTLGALSGSQALINFTTNPSRKNAKEAGLDELVTSQKERVELAKKFGNGLTAAKFEEQLRAAVSPEQAERDLTIWRARAEAAGESFDEYVSNRVKGIEKTTSDNSVYMAQRQGGKPDALAQAARSDTHHLANDNFKRWAGTDNVVLHANADMDLEVVYDGALDTYQILDHTHEEQVGGSYKTEEEAYKAADQLTRGDKFVTGKPVVAKVYHGSPAADFQRFDRNKLGANTGARSAKKGFFFAGNPETAGMYTGFGWGADAPETGITVNHEGWKFVEDNLLRGEVIGDIEWKHGADIRQDKPKESVPGLYKAIKETDRLGRLAESQTDKAERSRMLRDAEDIRENFLEKILQTLPNKNQADAWKDAYKVWYDAAYQNPDTSPEKLSKWVNEHPKETKEIVERAAKRAGYESFEYSTRPAQDFGGGGTMPVYVRMKNPLVFDYAGGDYTDKPFSKSIQEGIDGGHDGVILMRTYDGGPIDNVFITFDEKNIKSALGNQGTFKEKPSILAQKNAPKPRGEIQFHQDDGLATIRLFENQNESTFIHESAHLFRRDLKGDDLKEAERWAGVTDGKWNRKAEEKFARGFERYLYEGVAPNKQLESIFARFKAALSKIYSVLAKSPINVDISPEMRTVFDRMLTPSETNTQTQGATNGQVQTEGRAEGQVARAPHPLDDNSPLELGTFPPPESDMLSQAPVSPDLAAKNASMDEARAAMGLPEINQPAAPGANMPHHIAEQEAIRQRIPERASGIVMDYLSDKRKEPLNQLETAGLAVYGDRLNERYAQLQEDVNNLTLDEGERMTKAAEMERIEQDFDLLSRAMRQSGTAQSLAFSQRKHVVGSDYRPLSVESRAAAAKGKKLTNQEKRKLRKATSDLKAADENLEAQKQKEAAKVETTREKIKKTVKKLKEYVAKAKLPTDLNRYAQDLAKQYLAEGVTGRRELIDKVQKAVREIFPETQRRQVIDAISGYGDFKELSKDEASVRLRDLKGQLQQISKLKDMSEGKAPSKTGMERRDPSDTERALIKEVNEAKKEGGYEVTDPAKQLASALSTIKTRLRNQIKDLQAQIDSRQKLIKQKKAAPSDEETKRLTEERDALKTQFDDIFGKEGLTDAQRIANAERAAQRSIDDLEKRLNAGDFKPRPKYVGNPVPENLAKLRDKAAALRKKYAETNTNPPALEAAKERLAVLEAHLKAGTVPEINPRVTSKNPAMKAIQQRLADARKELAQSEPSQRARLRKSIGELQAKLEAGQFTLPDGAPRPASPEIERLQYERDKLRRKIRAEINELRPKTVWDRVASPLNLSRSFITTFDLPPMFRQGSFITLGNPVRSTRAAVAGLRGMFSDFNARKQLADIEARPNAPLYARAKLYLADMDGSPSAREEAFVGRLADKIPIIRSVIRSSERNYTVFLNRLRADTFDAMAASLARNGEPTMEEAQHIARFINIATGRGDFGRFEQTMSGLAPVFFSPRYVGSRLQLLALQPLSGGSAATKKLIAKEYGKMLIGAGLVATLAMAAGAEMEDDPTDPDFLKLKFGNTRLDFLGGLSQTAVITTRMGYGTAKTIGALAIGKTRATKYAKSEAAVAGRFLRSKLSPMASLSLNLATGEDYSGEKVTKTKIGQDLFQPLSFRDVKDAVEEQGWPAGLSLWLVSLFGVGMQTYND